jgi:hypothetical protein
VVHAAGDPAFYGFGQEAGFAPECDRPGRIVGVQGYDLVIVLSLAVMLVRHDVTLS